MATKKFYTKDKHYAELKDLLLKVRKGYNASDNFSLVIEILAISLSNLVHTEYYDEREKRYLNLIRGADLNAIIKAVAYIMQWINEQGTPMDVLGPYHTWLGLDNKHTGQFFTPWNVACLMAELNLGTKKDIMARIEKEGYMTFDDPTCGAGGTLLAAAHVLDKMGINYNEKAVFYGMELVPTTAYTCFVQCALYGLPAVICHGDSIKMDTYETFVSLAYWEMRAKAEDLDIAKTRRVV